MSTHEIFGSLLPNESKHQILIQNYFVVQNDDSEEKHGTDHKYYAFQEPGFDIPEPKVSIWDFLNKEDLTEYLKLHSEREIKKYLGSMTLDKHFPKGTARIIFIQLLYSVTKYCKTHNYCVKKSGALLSQFYLTHILATSGFDRTTEKVYTYFKELSLVHTLPDFPPKSAKIFSQDETKKNMELFCRLYLRNLPLIRFVCLPNFAFLFHYEYEVEASNEKEEKKQKRKRGKSGSKKGSKAGSKAGTKK